MKEYIKRSLAGKKGTENSALSGQVKIQEDIQRLAAEVSVVSQAASRYIPSNLKITEDLVLVKLYNSQKIFVTTKDMAVSPHIILDGIWEPEITHAWTALVKPDSVVFDVGANHGYYGLIASQLLDRKKSKVVYFEPNPHLSKIIEKSVAFNWFIGNSSVENCAVSDKEGEAKLTVLKDYIGSSSLHSADHLKSYLGDVMDVEADEYIKTKTISIDTYCKKKKIKKIDLMKLDVEGYEDHVYDGMSSIVAASPDLILFIEFTKKSYENPKIFFKAMEKDFNYIYKILPDGSLSDATDLGYNELIEPLDDWIMLVFSKNTLK